MYTHKHDKPMRETWWGKNEEPNVKLDKTVEAWQFVGQGGVWLDKCSERAGKDGVNIKVVGEYRLYVRHVWAADLRDRCFRYG